MLTRSKLERLARLASDEGIASLFIRLEPRLRYEQGRAATKLRSAFARSQNRETSKKWKDAAERERARIER